MQELLDGELMKLLRNMLPVLMILLLAVTALEGYFIHANADAATLQEQQIQALILQDTQLRADNAQSAQQFQTFLQQFVADDNYECQTLARLALHANLPQPAPGICAITSIP